nr:reverse transcriptase domain-containing protein [Tanacetum cinerariifolium]
MMANQRTMAELLQAPTEGYEDAIVVPAILPENLELKHGLLNLVSSKQFCGHDKEDLHTHIRWFNKITSTMSFKDLLRACPHHGFTELHQLANFYNAINPTDQDSLNAVVGGNFLDKIPRDCLRITETNTPLNENCLAVLLKKLPEKLRDPGKFLIPCDFPELDECLALADLAASINLMPLSIWEKLSLLELTPSRMTLELADRLSRIPINVAEDVFVKVGTFHFLADFVVVDYDVDPRVPIILGRPFLRTSHALIDVYSEELTLRINDEAITFTGGDFILEEIEACLARKSIPPRINDTDFDPKGDIRLLEKLINDNPSSSPLHLKELNVEEIKTVKSSIEELPKLELKDLPSHLECMMAIFHEMIEEMMEYHTPRRGLDGIRVRGHDVISIRTQSNKERPLILDV